MIERRKGHVENVSLIKEIEPGFSQFCIQIDFDEYMVFYDATQLLQFVNKDVYYTTRPDVIDGVKHEVVCEIALVTEVVTLDRTSTDIKLIPFDCKRPVCNFNIKDVKFGDFKVGCIAILTGIDKGESRKAKWIDCHLIDAYGQAFDLRMFTNISNVDDISKYEAMINGYVEFELESTKYGYQTSVIAALPQDVEQSPEIAISKNVAMEYIESDAAIYDLVTQTGLESAIDKYVDTEPGYLWVRIASELYMISTLENITSGLNIEAMRRATIVTRLFTLPHNIAWSNSVINTVKVLRFSSIIKDEDLRSIVDLFYKGTTTATRTYYYKIRDMVDSIIKLRRGFDYGKETFGGSIDELHAAFSGLL